ncbi:MAG: YdeI/OmpD-associated family protein [Thermoanaerobaculia bacterium]
MTVKAGDTAAQPLFFANPGKLRAWLERHHARRRELWVGFHKRDSGTPSITWPESVDEALCFGWIDGVRKRLDADRYVIRFTPRQSTSTWSAVNIRRMAELAAEGRVRAAGERAFAARSQAKSGIYSYEQRHAAALAAEQEELFRSNERAWRFFQRQPPWYRRTATFWVVSAKREETRRKRLAELIDCCAREVPIRALARPKKPQ